MEVGYLLQIYGSGAAELLFTYGVECDKHSLSGLSDWFVSCFAVHTELYKTFKAAVEDHNQSIDTDSPALFEGTTLKYLFDIIVADEDSVSIRPSRTFQFTHFPDGVDDNFMSKYNALRKIYNTLAAIVKDYNDSRKLEAESKEETP